MSEATFQTVRALAFVGVLAVAAAAEALRPHARGVREWRTNLGLWLIDAAAVGAVCGTCACTVAGWAARSGFGALNRTLAPAWLAIPVTVLALDATSYAWHRANHRLRWLWRFHRVHHADRLLNATTALRFHPGELLLSLPVRLTMVALLGAPVVGVAAFEVLFTCANVMEHANWAMPPGLDRVLTRVVVTPALHRRHHSVRREELDSNFGTILTVWDRIGTTYGASDARRMFTAGLPDRAERLSLLDALREPLRAG